ncbi:DUF5134 domain-containing protein [Streptomyces sp. NPDC007861]|uniref:DUF5134 domain-containing protein n=1 Tax=Streptomyces sp. NPDC007861 TaxID=3154893 RepID=UPI0033DBE617
MHGPATPGWLLVALCAASGAYCLLRARSCTGDERRSAGGEAVMGFGMAAMAVPAAVVPPLPWAWAGYAALFGTAALWALRGLWAARSRASHGDTHHLHHLAGSLAMVYMALTMAPGTAGGHAHHVGTGGVPLVTGVLLVYFVTFVLRTGARLVPVAAAATPAGATVTWGARPELALACRLSMGVAMVAMLLTV